AHDCSLQFDCREPVGAFGCSSNRSGSWREQGEVRAIGMGTPVAPLSPLPAVCLAWPARNQTHASHTAESENQLLERTHSMEQSTLGIAQQVALAASASEHRLIGHAPKSVTVVMSDDLPGGRSTSTDLAGGVPHASVQAARGRARRISGRGRSAGLLPDLPDSVVPGLVNTGRGAQASPSAQRKLGGTRPTFAGVLFCSL